VERPFKAAMPAFERAFRVAQSDSMSAPISSALVEVVQIYCGGRRH
jgi:hypothetical protein